MHTNHLSPSFVEPCTNPRLNKDFHLSQQAWLELAITPFHELTADSSLRMLVASASLAQRSRIYQVFLYVLLFDGENEKILIMSKPGKGGTAVGSVWTVPHQGVIMSPDVDGRTRIRNALAAYCGRELGTQCESAVGVSNENRLPGDPGLKGRYHCPPAGPHG